MKRYIHNTDNTDYGFEETESIELANWEKIASKNILDWDGFMTEYSLWRNIETDEYATVFGDTDIYNPIDDADFEFGTNADEAWEFYDTFTTGESEDF